MNAYEVNCVLQVPKRRQQTSNIIIILYSYYVLIVTCVTFQRRGPGSDDKDMANPFNGKRFTVCMFLPMEIVSLSERVKVVDVCKLVEIPSKN